MNTNKLTRFVITAVLGPVTICCTTVNSYANAVFRETYIIINGGPQSGDYYYEGLDNGGGNVRFDSINQSINLLSGATLTLKGAEAKTLMSGGDYQNSNNGMTNFYRFYDSASTAPAYNAQVVPFVRENPYPENLFQKTDASVNLLSGQDSGVHYMDFYMDGNASYFSGGQQFFDMTQTATYRATFTLFYGATTTATQSAAFTGTGYFNFNGNGQTYTLDKANTYTGETQIDAGTVSLTGSLAAGSMIYVGNGGNSSNAAFSISGTTTLSNNIQVNTSSGSGTRELIKADATSQTLAGNIANNRASTINVTNSGGNLTASGVISGTNITKTGSGTMVLSGSSANTFSGLTINAGQVVFNKSANIAAVGGAVEVASGATLSVSAVNQFGNNAVDVDGTLNLNGNNQSLALYNSGTGTVNLGAATLTNNNAGNDTFAGAITGTDGNLVKAGNGTLILSGANTYTGTTLISAGGLQIGAGGSTGSLGSGNITNNATLAINRTGEVAMANAISGTGALNKLAAGTLTLSANNSYSGETVVDGGTLALNGSGAVASSSVVKVGTNAVFDISGVTTSATVKGLAEQGVNDGGSVKLGSKGLTMSGGSGTYLMNILGVSGDTGTFTLNDADSTLSLYGSSQYTGATTLSAGTLSTSAAMSSASYALSGGNLTTSSGANLSDSTAVTLSSGSSTFTVGASDTIGSIAGTAGTINITNSGTLTLGANTTSSFSGVISGNGALIKGGTGTLTLDGSSANTYSGTTTVNAGVLVLSKSGDVNALAGTPTINNGGIIRLGAGNQFNGNSTFLTVSSGGEFDMNGFNETLAIQGSGTVTLGGGTITLNPGNADPGDSFTGVIAGASGNVVKTNTGLQILGGNSTYNGTTTVGAGVLRISHNNALGATSGATTVNSGAALQLSNGITVGENITLNGTGVGGLAGALRNVSGDNTVTGTLTLGSNARIGATGGSLSVGAVSGGSNVFYVGGTGNSAITGVLSGAGSAQDGTTTSLFKDGAATLTLSGNNSYTGDTRITAGNVTVASGGSLGSGSDVFISSGASLTINTNTTVASIREAGNANGGTAAIGSGATLTINGANRGTLFQNSISGAGNLAVNASGDTSLSLYGTQSYTGTTTVSGGKLSTGVALASSGVTVNGGTFETSAADILGSGASVAITSGTYALGGNDTVGSFSISGGALSGSSTLTASTYILNGGTVTANLGAGTATASSGTTALDGTLAATTVNISGGTVNLGANDRLANGAAVTVSGGTLGMGSRTDTVGSLTMSGGTLGGSGTLTASSYALNGGNINAVLGAGAVTVGGGTNTLGSAGRLNSGSSLTVNSGQLTLGGNEIVSSLAGAGGTLNLGANSLTLGGNSYSNRFDGVISGTGSLVKNGTGTLQLAGINTYSGGTFLNNGYLDSEDSSAFGTGSITVASLGTLNLESHNVTNHIVNNGGTILSTGTVSDVVASNGTTSIGGSNSVVVEVSGNATVDVSGSNVTVSNVSGGTVTLSNTATGSTVNAASAGTVNAAAADVNVGTVSGTAEVNLAGANAQVTTVSGGTVTLSNTATGSRVNTASAGTVNANAAGVNVGTVSNTATVNVGGADGRVTTLAGGTVNANAAGLVVTNFNGGNIAVASRVTVGLQSGSSAGVISGQGGIAKQGASTLTLSGVNTYSGATTVEEGKLIVNGSVASSAVTVQSGAILGGGGTIGSLTLNGILAPGNSAGTTTANGNTFWNQGSSYDWEIYDLNGPAGTGWDLLSVTGGTLDLTGITTAGGFTINLITLQGDNNTQGALTGFNPATNYATGWMIASASSISGFNASEFNINKNLFVSGSGTFAIEQRAISGGQGLFVTYTGGGSEPIPEPGTWAAAALLAGAAGYVRWRRRKEQAKDA